MNNLRFRNFYRRRLPHIQIAGATYFVTFRLHNSLPHEILDELSKISEQIKRLPKDKFEIEFRRWFEKLDDYLDNATHGPIYLGNTQVANIVAEAIHYRDMKIFDLISFCIIPNHVHLVCTPLEREKDSFYSLTEILHSLKRHTARQSNLILGRSGSFWQDESYDHVVRKDAEFERIVQYVLHNPVKAKLVKEHKDWKWMYSKHEM